MSSVINDEISGSTNERGGPPQHLILLQNLREAERKIDRIDVFMMILLWVVSAWAIVAERLCDEKNEYVSDESKFWIALTIPIATSATALLETIQVGMEYHNQNQHANGSHTYREVDVETVPNAGSTVVVSDNGTVSKVISIHSPSCHSPSTHSLHSPTGHAKQSSQNFLPNSRSKLQQSTISSSRDTGFLLNNKQVDTSASHTETNSDDTDEYELEDFNNRYLGGNVEAK